MLNDDQIANWRAGMAVLTAWFTVDDTERIQTTVDMLTADYKERGVEGITGAALGLQGIAAITIQLLAAATGKTSAETLQTVGRAFEQYLTTGPEDWPSGG